MIPTILTLILLEIGLFFGVFSGHKFLNLGWMSFAMNITFWVRSSRASRYPNLLNSMPLTIPYWLCQLCHTKNPKYLPLHPPIDRCFSYDRSDRYIFILYIYPWRRNHNKKGSKSMFIKNLSESKKLQTFLHMPIT